MMQPKLHSESVWLSPKQTCRYCTSGEVFPKQLVGLHADPRMTKTIDNYSLPTAYTAPTGMRDIQ